MDFRLLGPLEVRDNGRELSPSGAKQRTVLALLLLHANEVVSSDRLIEGMWGDAAPATAGKSLQVHVSRLRSALAEARIDTRAGGYVLRVEPGELDLERFEALLQEGSAALETDPERAARLLEQGLALWRGPPLADFTYEPFAQREIGRLEELHITGVEERIEAELALGRAPRLVGELEGLVEQHPFRERLRAQLMLALYRSGRQAEALAAYQAARRALVEELGIEPSAELRDLERAVLAQEPGLDLAIAAEPGHAEEPGPAATHAAERSRRLWLALAGGGLLIAAAVLGIALIGGGDDAAPLSNDSQGVAIIDPASNDVTEAIPTGSRPGPLAFDAETDTLWVANLDDKTVTHIDARSRRAGRSISVPGLPGGSLFGGSVTGPRVGGIAAGHGAVWVAGADAHDRFVTVWKIDPRFDTIRRAARIRSPEFTPVDVALTDEEVWVAPAWGLLTRLDPETGTIRRPGLDPGHPPTALATTPGAIWMTNDSARTVTRVDSSSGLTTSLPVGGAPGGIAVGAGMVWVTIAQEDALVQLDPRSASVRRTIEVGRRPAGVAVGAGAVWVANSRDGTVSRVDPATGEVDATVPVGPSPQDIEVAGGRVWVSIRPKTVGAAPRQGGVATVEVAEEPTFLDPALAWGVLEWMLGYATGAKLVNYPDDPSHGGSRPVPEVAEALPTLSADGRTYTFRIREGFRFSPPSGEPVTAETFKRSIERSLDPDMGGPAGDFLSDVVGAKAFREGKAEELAGVRVRGDTLTMELTRPSGDFLARIAMPFFSAVPPDAPVDPDGVRVLASAGPYYVASNEPGEGVVLKRNPNYGGSRPHRLREIQMAVGVGARRAIENVEAGRADFAPKLDPNQAGRALARRYGPGSEAAREGRQRYFVNPQLGVEHMVLNTTRPAFASARMRRAVNYAVDRRALAQTGGLNFGGPALPTDQYLPPGLPGFDDERIYPSTPDLAQARRLARGGPRSVVLYAFDSGTSPELAQIVKVNLSRIGIDVDVRLFPVEQLFERVERPGERYDMAMMAWYADYADPANFLSLLHGRTSAGQCELCAGLNFAHFDDSEFNRRLAAAARLSGPRRYLTYGEIERDMARDAAPWVAFGNEAQHDFFSDRIGCQSYHPIYGMDLAALCLRD